MLLMTVMHSGTNSVRAYYKDLGHNIMYQHCVPAGKKWINKMPWQITTLRNPYRVAASWIHHNDYNRFGADNWEYQWTLWQEIVREHYFGVIVIENFDQPVKNKSKNPIPDYVEVPESRVLFAQDVINSVRHLITDCPYYTNPWRT
jgi:hypothetical protein